MRTVILLATCVCLTTTVKSQPLSDQSTTEEQSIFFHIVSGFEIGSNFLDIAALNSELSQLGLLNLDPYTNNFTFQVGAGLGRIEFYTTLTLLGTSNFSEIIGTDRLFLSSTMNGDYIGFGVRGQIVSVLKNRLSLMGSVDQNSASYFLRISRATITDRTVGPLLDSSRAIMANSNNRIIQPALELLYTTVKGKHQLDIGLKVGYIYHLREESWENQHGVGILGLSPIGNNESYNVALRFVYSIALPSPF